MIAKNQQSIDYDKKKALRVEQQHTCEIYSTNLKCICASSLPMNIEEQGKVKKGN